MNSYYLETCVDCKQHPCRARGVLAGFEEDAQMVGSYEEVLFHGAEPGSVPGTWGVLQ